MIRAIVNERILENAAARAQRETPAVSVLTPFHNDDPAPLLTALARMGEGFDVTLGDDGSNDIALLARLAAHIERLPIPVRIVVRERNQGRAQTRNRLIQEARARHALFLDADMIPANAQFMARWLALARWTDPAIAFGGFVVTGAPRDPQTDVHRALAARADCKPAALRKRAPAQHVATSNLLVRRDILHAAPFDEAFKGWGWEDVEWALRAARFGAIDHIDNPAIHTGLDSVTALLRKYDQAGPNYARMTAKHPHAVAAMPSRRAAMVMNRLPVRALRRFFAAIAKAPAPILLRCFALKLYRTSVYAEHIA